MTNTSEFDRALEKEIAKLKRFNAQLLKDITFYAFALIQNYWPVNTGWSRANNWVLWDGDRYPPLRPVKRPSGLASIGSLGPLSNQHTAQMLAEIRGRRFTENTQVEIASAVPYARDVGFSPGSGDRIYKAAGQEALAIAINLARARRGGVLPGEL